MLYCSIFFSIINNILSNCEDRPETYCNKDFDAVFTSTPTWLTAVSTTKVNALSSSFDLHHVDIDRHQ